jgi:hypothetical protein
LGPLDRTNGSSCFHNTLFFVYRYFRTGQILKQKSPLEIERAFFI